MMHLQGEGEAEERTDREALVIVLKRLVVLLRLIIINFQLLEITGFGGNLMFSVVLRLISSLHMSKIQIRGGCVQTIL